MAKPTQLSTFGKITGILIIVGIIYACFHLEDIANYLWSFPFVRGYASGLSSFYYIFKQLFVDDRISLMYNWTSSLWDKWDNWAYIFGQLLGSVGSATLLGRLVQKFFS